MKVLHIITQGKIGGATNVVFWLAEGLKKKNIQVEVGFGEGNFLKEKLEKANIPWIRFKWLRRGYNPLFCFLFVLEIKNFLDKHKYEVVHFHSTNALFGAIGAKLSKTKPKTVFTFHGLSILDPNYKKTIPLKPIFCFIFKFLLMFVNVPVFVAQNNLTYAKKLRLVKKGFVIYNGIPKPLFLDRKEAQRTFEKITKSNLDNKFVIGSIGRLVYQKNYEFLIKLFPEILKIKKEAVLILIGEGGERERLKKLITRLGLQNKVFLLGEIREASKLIKGFDLFVLPSRYEGLPITLIEALFAKVPVLASDVGGNKEILPSEMLFDLNCKEDFINEVRMLDREKIRISSGRFTLQKMVEEYISLYLKSI